jgi:hypothetical protein
MKELVWLEISTSFFDSIRTFGYTNGRLINNLERIIKENSNNINQINYCKYIDGGLCAVIVKRNMASGVLRQSSNWQDYTAVIKDYDGFSYHYIYGNDPQELKLKVDLYMIDQGYKIIFPGV